MNVVHTVLAAIVCMALVAAVDMGITKIFDEKSVWQRKCIKIPLSYFIGILVFLLIVRLILS